MRIAFVAATIAVVLGCGRGELEPHDAGTGAGGGTGGTGAGGTSGAGGGAHPDAATDAPSCPSTAPARTCDPACPVGQLCWDFKDHDPYCGGRACTAPCCTNADCVAFFGNHAGAENARCGSDHLCDPIGFGGSFFCAAR